MGKGRRSWRRLRAHLAGGLAVPLLLPLFGETRAADTLPDTTAPAVAPAEVRTLTLQECLDLALSQQPALTAQRASLASAATASRALEALRVPTFLARDLPVRRKQAALGVSVAAAGLDQAERETIYAVTRLYYTVQFARSQKKVADDVVNHLKVTRETASRLVEGGSRDVTTSSVDKVTVYLRLAETRVADAQNGIDRALAALKEAIGLEPGCCLTIPEQPLPELEADLCLAQVVDLALARRGELQQAVTTSRVTCLEVKAQGSVCRPQVPTFAAVADLHSRSIPQGSSDGEYRPGAVGPEMPTTLVGSKSYRVERAQDLYQRSTAVVDKTRNLIALEAEDAYYKWEQAARKVPQTKEAAAKGAKLADDTRRDFGGEQRVKPEDVLANEVLAAQARAQYNEARYQLILALAGLERVTAGGFCANLVNPPAPAAAAPAPPEPDEPASSGP